MATFLVVERNVVTTTFRVEGETILDAWTNFKDGDKSVVEDDLGDRDTLLVCRVEPDGQKQDVTEEWDQAEGDYGPS